MTEKTYSEEDYWYVVRHADRGWTHLHFAVSVLEKIAEGDCECAKLAREARYELPRGYVHDCE